MLKNYTSRAPARCTSVQAKDQQSALLSASRSLAETLLYQQTTSRDTAVPVEHLQVHYYTSRAPAGTLLYQQSTYMYATILAEYQQEYYCTCKESASYTTFYTIRVRATLHIVLSGCGLHYILYYQGAGYTTYCTIRVHATLHVVLSGCRLQYMYFTIRVRATLHIVLSGCGLQYILYIYLSEYIPGGTLLY